MPTISQVSVPVTEFPNRFISPFADDPIVPLYSSIPIRIQNDNCLPCAICASSPNRSRIIQEQASKFSGFASEDESFVGVNAYEPFWITAVSSNATVSNVKITFSVGTLRIEWGDGSSDPALSNTAISHTY